MDDIVVLGLIPGTHIQITFFMWLVAASSLAALIIMRASYRTQTFQAVAIASSITLYTRRTNSL